jgi:DNA-binding XRE family transcriptional regulator
MTTGRDWLWDRKISLRQARQVLREPANDNFLSLAGLLLARKNTPQEVFRHYLRPQDFLLNWRRIKIEMRKDNWNNPRIAYWQAVYDKLRVKYKKKISSLGRAAEAAKARNEFSRKIGERLRAVRRQKGLTQSEVAKRLKVTQQLISRVEKGGENISLRTLQNIVNGLGASLNVDIY